VNWALATCCGGGAGAISLGDILGGPSAGDDILGLLTTWAAPTPLLLLLRVLAAPRMTLIGISLTFSLNVSLLKGVSFVVEDDVDDAGLPPPMTPPAPCDAAGVSGDMRADPTFIGEEARPPKVAPNRSPNLSAKRSAKGDPAPTPPPTPPPPEKMEGMEGI